MQKICFFPLARFSKTPKYNNHGRNFISKKNEYLFSVINNEKDKVDDFKYSKIKFWKRKMKSPAMFCYVIQSEVEEIPIGVISFQGMTPFTKNQIKDIKSASIDIEKFC